MMEVLWFATDAWDLYKQPTKSWFFLVFRRFSCHKKRVKFGVGIWSLCPLIFRNAAGVGGTETFEARSRRDDEFRGEEGQQLVVVVMVVVVVVVVVVFHTHLRSAETETLNFPKLKRSFTKLGWWIIHSYGLKPCKLASSFVASLPHVSLQDLVHWIAAGFVDVSFDQPDLYSFPHNHGSVENGCIWKVTILQIRPFLNEPWLWEEG